MSKHTPGPWMHHKTATPAHSQQYVVYPEGQPNDERCAPDIAIIYHGEHAEANAAAIAALPDLIAALEEISERAPVVGYGSADALRLRLVLTQSIARTALGRMAV